MASVGSQVSKECVQRLQRELREMAQNPNASILAAPKPSDLCEWHFVLLGPSDTVYEGGVYHGKLVFPPTYPHAPPAIYMLTPSGRFQPGAKICLSMSDFHLETWSPAWTGASILLGLLSFMVETDITAGSIVTTDAEKVQFAEKSLAFNKQNELFRTLFPMLCDDEEEDDDDA